MTDLKNLKRRSIELQQQEKETFYQMGMRDEDFPCFFTEEVLDMLDISRPTLYRIRRILHRSRSAAPPSCPATGSRGWKNRYSMREINEIKQYIKEKNTYRSPLENIDRQE